MTIEEAVNVLKCIVIDTEDLSAGVKRTQEKALDFTIKALEKQMPKKPNRGVCPGCGSRHIYAATLMAAECFEYCGDCGQALDWSDSND